MGPTLVIRPLVFIAPRPKAIAESTHCVPMATANKSIRQIVRVASTKIVFLATCFVTNHWVNANQTITVSSLALRQQSLDLSATTPMDRCHTLQRLPASAVKTTGAPTVHSQGCIATHQNPNVKQYPTRLGFRPAIR